MSNNEGKWERCTGKFEKRKRNNDQSNSQKPPEPERRTQPVMNQRSNFLKEEPERRTQAQTQTQPVMNQRRNFSTEEQNARPYSRHKPASRIKKIDLNDETDFPIVPMNNLPVNIIDTENSYSSACKEITNETNTEVTGERLKNGWISFRSDKHTKQITYSKDGLNYVPMSMYLAEQEEQEQTNRNHALNQLIDQREKESYEYYELTGELDDYAIAKIERYEYEEYAKQFDNNEDDEVNDYINEDNFSDYDSDRSS
tara:strand:+ start:640 stop:1407 length:768 start_codon:yes stop_codon:yes gene_type:complete